MGSAREAGALLPAQPEGNKRVGEVPFVGRPSETTKLSGRLRPGQGRGEVGAASTAPATTGQLLHVPWANKAAPAWQHLSQRWQEPARGQEGWQASETPFLSSQECQNPEQNMFALPCDPSKESPGTSWLCFLNVPRIPAQHWVTCPCCCVQGCSIRR